MSSLPALDGSLLVRTSTRFDDRWQDLVSAVSQETSEGFRAYVEFVDGTELDQLTWQEVRKVVLQNQRHGSVLFIADARALQSPNFEILVIDLLGDSEPFRCIAEELWGVENNLNIGNIDWDDFALNTVEGVFQGFD